eukprot:TRINITY_DN3322_c0_g1_i9.p1 TRINITY_DN3322_c0_g1~~TRINITY_DN3322_c0_g1_i9.p1  ORF type:complete len:575 (-),score=110.19 TRINITY_DN3322_c0_g1_i9:369-2093(-)
MFPQGTNSGNMSEAERSPPGRPQSLHEALEKQPSEALVRELLRADGAAAALRERNAFGELPLHVAVKKKASEPVVRALIEACPGALGETSRVNGMLPLHCALDAKAPEAVVLALLQLDPEAAARARTRDAGGDLPLHLACLEKASFPIVLRLLQAYPEAMQERDNQYGMLPLQLAGDRQTCLALLKASAEVRCATISTPELVAVSARFATFPSLEGLFDATCSGVVSLSSLAEASDALAALNGRGGAVGEDVELPASLSLKLLNHMDEYRRFKQARLVEALEVLRLWHRGCALWSSCMERTMRKVTAKPAAQLIAQYLCGVCRCEVCSRMTATQHQPLQQGRSAVTETVVVENCVHEEAPAEEDPSDEIVLEVMWTQLVEMQIEAGMHHLPDGPGTSVDSAGSDELVAPLHNREHRQSPLLFGEKVYLMRCTRGGAQLHRALDHGRELDAVRETARQAEQRCHLPSGARIFVHPNNYDQVLSLLCDRVLGAHDVVVTEAFLPLVRRDIGALPSRANIRERSLETLGYVGDGGDAVAVHRTFIEARGTHEWETLTQSTSQAHRVANPRGRHDTPM